ncbi:MAG: penicillin-binding protein 2 [Rubellimicrobium sp.]|nr:penicillin-binding protein 2 [Rubellimicrobium sp.]
MSAAGFDPGAGVRSPLRPLARILRAREAGENPDLIEAEQRRRRHEATRDKARSRAQFRLMLLAFTFVAGFIAIGGRMAIIAASIAEEPVAEATGNPIINQRADITDRNGRILATNFDTHALYAQPRQMVNPERAATELARIFPELDQGRLLRDFTGGRTFLWIRRQISPEQMQAVHDIGDPGLLFGPREMRLYPNGPVAAHILGGYGYGREGVNSAEVIGTAGVERFFDTRLRDPAEGGEPLALSIDLTVQATMEEVLDGGMVVMNARGAAGILMDVQTGEIVAMASLPDFDPNNRPAPLTTGDAADSPLFNRAMQGVYELGSVFKIFAAAQALDLGLVNPETMIETRGPLTWGRFRITDSHAMPNQMTVADVIAESSNVGAARIAQMIGPVRQRAFLTALGLTEAVPLQMVEAPTGAPIVQSNWSDLTTLTVGFGHGISVSPLHLAAAYASLVNGGTRVVPTLLRQDRPLAGERVVSAETSAQVRMMLRRVVTDGTASFANIGAYAIGGKTGTAEKPGRGGYQANRNLATFASVFPAEAPRYVLIVTLDEPVETSGPQPRRTAGWTAVPVATEVIRRVAPLLGLRPTGTD